MRHRSHQKLKTRGRKIKSRRARQNRTRKQRGGALIDSVSRENEHKTIVTIRPDAMEEDSVPLTTRLTTARRLLEETDTGA